MITLSMPEELDLSMMVLSAGMRTSQPSRPKRFSEDHFLARKSSNLDRKSSVSSWHCGVTVKVSNLRRQKAPVKNEKSIFSDMCMYKKCVLLN